jgi:phosphoribosylformylglycinamidine cyclo-ligase
MAVIVAEENAEAVAQALEAAGETAFPIGRIEQGRRGSTVAGPGGSWSARGDWSATHDG